MSDTGVMVIGGGLAGIAAAVRLAQQGEAVTLVETRKRLGGRATSFVDPATGQVLDNCQHVLLGCCTNLLDLYQRLGVSDAIEWHRRLYFADSTGRVDVLEGDDLPAPLHMTRALLGFSTLSLAEKLAISRGMLAMMRLGRVGRDACEGITFAEWLREHGQPASAVRRFWGVVIISALNELPERCSASSAIQVFQEAFLENEQAYVMGLAAVPLVQLYDAAERVLAEAGGRVLLATSAESLEYDGRRVTALRTGGGDRLTADRFISAVPFDRLAKMCSPEMVAADARLASLGRFEVSPIIGIHLWLSASPERPVMRLPHLVLMESPLQWVFNKGFDGGADNDTSRSSTSEPSAGGQHLHGVISAAHDLVGMPADDLIALTVAEIRKVMPEARSASLLHGRVVKEKRATFSVTPGSDAIRPPARGAIENLYLAGDWCATGWPATMEGATRSGYLAAAAASSRAGDHPTAQPLAADLQASLLYRMIASPATG